MGVGGGGGFFLQAWCCLFLSCRMPGERRGGWGWGWGGAGTQAGIVLPVLFVE